ncbi:hypothetical protein SeMB42_g05636 [Synchytrium endobioticum]|uniref:Uncharacterized protein n=1 Tax=Synchytrium endobioticum TaxID=286115 RepID=A0A507CQ64_9FUNG|nr:hypothetical protein SeMB42_g05636 [Synchytrium endobioticum]
MGRQQKRDKLYITRDEWARDFGGAKEKKINNEYKSLPFWCCSLTLTPFEHPVCTKDGVIFDLVNIIPWIKKYATNPVNNEKLETKDLFKLNFAKSADASYHCPVTLKTFNQHTHIVAIKQTGNVYSYDAVKSLNIEPKNWKDLLTDEPFTRKDIITIQDPHNLGSHRNINEFYYVKNDLKPVAGDAAAVAASSNAADEAAATPPHEEPSNIKATGAMLRVLSQVKSTPPSAATPNAPVTLTPSFVSKQTRAYNEAHYSTGAASSSLTSTVLVPQLKNTLAKFNKDEYMFGTGAIKKNAFVQIQTNLGDINIELLATQVPKACYNFVMLAKSGYYKNVRFYRSIKNSIIQGGDPTGTGKGGESYWKKNFEDDFKPNLSHTGRGILSMANRGKDTNSSQFFITYKSCTHLDNKHTVFGKVVGGLETLSKMEKVPTDDRDRPTEPIQIKDVVVFVDPFADLQKEVEQMAEAAQKEAHRIRTAPRLLAPSSKSPSSAPPVNTSTAIGKYIAASSTPPMVAATERLKRPGSILDGDGPEMTEAKKVKTVAKQSFGNFDDW